MQRVHRAQRADALLQQMLALFRFRVAPGVGGGHRAAGRCAGQHVIIVVIGRSAGVARGRRSTSVPRRNQEFYMFSYRSNLSC